MAKKGNLDFEGLIANGENPNGMMAQTADATINRSSGVGPQDYRWNQNADGARWNSGFAPQPEAIFVAPAAGKRRRR